jgi:hypothetical protein
MTPFPRYFSQQDWQEIFFLKSAADETMYELIISLSKPNEVLFIY